MSQIQQEGYDHAAVERRWQEAWEKSDVYRTPDTATDPTYVLAMFPYPSGEMHMGHVRNYTITDAYARYKRMQGESVLHPMGWDSFGLPAENAANERDVDPRGWTMDCIANIKEQMNLMGLGFDWEREVTTCEPDYFRWNQWFFLKFYEEGLVERKETELNWCPSCETVLADENVNTEGGRKICWRCDTHIEHRDMEQWFFTITDYADELYESLDEMSGWPDNVREMQRNWIGKQEGDVVEFELTTGDSVEIFTTRLDTIYGATFFALAPGHGVTQKLAAEDDDVAEYVDRVAGADEGEIEQTSGVFTGEYAINPATGEEIPVYVADYVLEDIGTGALYAVPAHDQRDHAFAKEHDIEIRQVVEPAPDADINPDGVDVETDAYTEDGVLINSGEYDGLTSAQAREEFVETFDGERRIEYSLRDWCISRQRYWGTPIPFVKCPDCGYVAIPEEDLPVELPEFVQTTGNPLDAAEEWKQVECPECGGPAERETDTMDTFVDSSWYFLRYVSPDMDEAPFDSERANDWMPVNQYVGGIEHATMHLIYSRFFTKVLADMEMLNHREPFENLLTQGMVRKDGTAMSSSKGNVVSPRPFVKRYGADTARMFMMQAARPERDFDWSEEGVRSTYRFLTRLLRLVQNYTSGDTTAVDADPTAAYVAAEIDATIALATDDYEAMTFTTALREAQGLVATLRRYHDWTDGKVHAETFERGLDVAVRLLAPVIPHLCEELYEELGGSGYVVDAEWPQPESDTSNVEDRRRLVENTREDIRQIIDVAGISDPQRIRVAVTPRWKYRAREIAIESETEDLIPRLMEEDEIRRHGDAAADYGHELAAEREALTRTLSPQEEYEALREAAWLVEREFGTPIDVLTADEADEGVVAKAEPTRPGIEIVE